MKRNLSRLLYIFIVIASAGLFYYFDLHKSLQIEQLNKFISLIDENLVFSALIFSLVLILFSILNLPTFYFSIFFGYLYGFFPGLLVSLLSRTTGVILAYYNIHFLFHEVFTKKYGEQPQIKTINQLIEEKGFSAIIILRSLYIFPTSFLNAAFSISKIKPSSYFWGSAIGLLPTSVINVSMGYFIEQKQSLNDNPVLLSISISLAILLIVFSLLYMKRLKGN